MKNQIFSHMLNRQKDIQWFSNKKMAIIIKNGTNNTQYHFFIFLERQNI